MSRPYSRVLLTAGLIALSIGGVTSAGALSAQAAPNSVTSIDGLLDSTAGGSATASTADNASNVSAAAAAVDDGASTPDESPVGAQSPEAAGGTEGTEVEAKECADLEDFEVYDLTETGFKLRWTLPDNHPEYASFLMDGLGQYVVPVGDFPYTEAIGHHIKPGTRYLVGVAFMCRGGGMAGTPILTFTTPGVPPEPEFEWGSGATASMNASAAAGAEAAANATASSSGSASAEGSENAIANSAIEGSAGSGVSAAAEATANASASSGADTPIDVPASDRTSNTVANAAVARDERAVTDAAQFQAKALANTGHADGGLQVVSVGLVGTGLIALLGSLAYRLRHRRA